MDRLELVVFESRKKREELSSYDSFQEEEQFERDTVCLTLFSTMKLTSHLKTLVTCFLVSK